MVLYTGTPCQIAGLYKFLGKSYQNQLITLDLVCHGVPSLLVFETYLRKLKNRPPMGRRICVDLDSANLTAGR